LDDHPKVADGSCPCRKNGKRPIQGNAINDDILTTAEDWGKKKWWWWWW